MAWYGYGGTFGDVLNQWKTAGIFDILLPFLLIFALVYGILDKTKIFTENKAINPIIGFVVALLALQFDLVPQFFAVIFPKLGIGLAVVLVVLILLGIFMPREGWVNYVLFGIVAIVLIIVLVYTSQDLGWSAGYWWSENWSTVAGAIFILIILGVIVGASASDKPKFNENSSKFFKDMFGHS